MSKETYDMLKETCDMPKEIYISQACRPSVRLQICHRYVIDIQMSSRVCIGVEKVK